MPNFLSRPPAADVEVTVPPETPSDFGSRSAAILAQLKSAKGAFMDWNGMPHGAKRAALSLVPDTLYYDIRNGRSVLRAWPCDNIIALLAYCGTKTHFFAKPLFG